MVNLSLSDIDLEFIATKSGQKGSALNPERALVRYQLMEVLCRIGIQKYYHSKWLRVTLKRENIDDKDRGHKKVLWGHRWGAEGTGFKRVAARMSLEWKLWLCVEVLQGRANFPVFQVRQEKPYSPHHQVTHILIILCRYILLDDACRFTDTLDLYQASLGTLTSRDVNLSFT